MGSVLNLLSLKASKLLKDMTIGHQVKLLSSSVCLILLFSPNGFNCFTTSYLRITEAATNNLTEDQSWKDVSSRVTSEQSARCSKSNDTILIGLISRKVIRIREHLGQT